MRPSAAVVAAFVLAAAGSARAGLTQEALASVGAAVHAGARAPLGLRFLDDHGRPTTLSQAVGGRPTVLLIADYRCRYLCGPGATLTSSALDQAPLKAGRDYSFVVVGLNPQSTPAEAAAFRVRRLKGAAGAKAVLLTGGRPDLVAKALGYRYLYDPKLGQYAHDTSIYALSSDGVVRAVLPEFDLTGPHLAAAVRDARRGWTGALAEQVRLICYCLQPLTGVYDHPAVVALRAGGAGVLAAMAGAFFYLRRRRREARS